MESKWRNGSELPTALVIGNGPSGWWIQASMIEQLRSALSARTVTCCNLAAKQLPTDAVAAVDRDVIVELARAGALAGRTLICGDLVWRRLTAGGEVARDKWFRVQLLDCIQTGYSSGIAAIEGAIASGHRRLVLVGFDGSNDQRTRFQGQPLYRTAPTRRVVFCGWERRMREIAAEHGDRVEWWKHSTAETPAPEDLPGERLDLREFETAAMPVEQG